MKLSISKEDMNIIVQGKTVIAEVINDANWEVTGDTQVMTEKESYEFAEKFVKSYNCNEDLLNAIMNLMCVIQEKNIHRFFNGELLDSEKAILKYELK